MPETIAATSNRPRWQKVIAVVLLLALRVVVAGSQRVDVTALTREDQITDTVFFEDIKDPNRKHYLPRYRIATQTVSGDSQYRVRFYKQAQATFLEIYLEKYAPPELGDAARNAQELAHTVSVALRHLTPNQGRESGSFKSLDFQETTKSGTGYRAVMRLATLQERDALLLALEDPKLDAHLVIKRTFVIRHAPRTQIAGMEKENYEKRFSWAHAGRAGVVIPKSDWDKLDESDRQVAELKKNGSLVTTSLDSIESKRPFSFDRKLYAYVFAGLTTEPGNVAQLVREQVSWKDQYYSYFRTPDRTDRWYYLPDRFVLAKRNALPSLRVQFGGPPDSQFVDLEYEATAFVEPERISSANTALGLGTSQTIKLEPLVANDASLWASFPGSDGGDGPFQRRTGASVDLRTGLRDKVRLTPEGFQKIYAALFSRSHTLFSGEVRLTPDGVSQEQIPFEARITELSPEAFWDKAISPLVFAEYQRAIQVKTTAGVFAGEVKTLIVAFKESDEDAELVADRLESQVTVKLPMRDFILNKDSGGEYHYRVTAVRERNGKFETTRMSQWKVGSEGILYPPVP